MATCLQQQYEGAWLAATGTSTTRLPHLSCLCAAASVAELATEAARAIDMFVSSGASAAAVEAELVSSAGVVFCTLVTCGRPTFANGQPLRADMLLVDEAAQALEPEVMAACCVLLQLTVAAGNDSCTCQLC